MTQLPNSHGSDDGSSTDKSADRWSSSDNLNIRHYIGPHFKHREPTQENASQGNDTPRATRKLVQKLKNKFSREQPLLAQKSSRSEVASVHLPEEHVDLDLTTSRSVSQGGYDPDAHLLSLSSVLRLPRVSIASTSRPWLPSASAETPLLSASDGRDALQDLEDYNMAERTESAARFDAEAFIYSASPCATNADRTECSVVGNVLPSAVLCGGNVQIRSSSVEGEKSKSSEASVHLYDMRISQHLRSLSSMSYDSMELSSSDFGHAQDVSDIVNVRQQKPSDASFQSLRVPSSWGRVVSSRTLPSHDGPSDELTPSVVSRASRQSVSVNYDETAAAWERAARKASISNFALKPLDTEHSFDRLTIPSRQGSEPPSPSSPTIHYELPAITVTSAIEHQQKHTPSSLVAWSRYPSHTRKERTGSAGILDDILVRDFEAPSIITDDSGRCSRDRERLDKKRRAKAKSLIFKKKLFLDLPRLFKSRSVGFHKGERGHRSSIGPGGLLEYPELELLPAAEPRLPSKSVVASPLPSPAIGDRGAIAFRSTTMSSRYDSHPSRFASSSSNDSGQLLSASDWAAIYGGCVQRRSTEVVSPLDNLDDDDDKKKKFVGEEEKQDISRPRSTGARSLPTSLEERALLYSDTVRSVSSMQRLRRSTQDLFKMLEEDEEKEKEKALRAAELVWLEEAS